jgi:GT2 family glycosyltransferase
MLADARGDGPAWGDGLRKDHRRMAVELSYCVASTEQRQLLRYCLDAIARERAAVPFATEVLVLDNASRDGSAEAARSHPATTEVIEVAQRRGRPANHTELLRRAGGRFCLLLNEDSELEPGATAALHAALSGTDRAAAAGAKLLRPDGETQPSAWRFPTPAVALLTALWLHRRFVVQSRGKRTRKVDWAQSAALLVRREAAAEIGWFDPQFFVYSDEVDFCKRLHGAGWSVLYVPEARAVHHEQLSTGPVPERRIVELSRNRDRYMRKHHSAGAAALVRWLTAFTYAMRAAAAVVAPGHDPRRYARHVSATLFPARGEGLAEAAADFNRGGPRL